MKRIIRQIMGWSLMLTLPLVMTSCEDFFAWLDNPVTPTIQVLRAQLTLKVGESLPLRANTQPHVVLLYSSDNPAVATVDAEGVVTAIAEGTTTITIKAQGEDDYYRTEIFSENTTTVEVTVTKKDGSISFATADFTKHVGDAAFTNPVTIVGDGTVSYSSDNEEVAKVNPTTGEVTIVGKGLATIKATIIDTDMFAYKTKTTQYTLKVYRFIDLATQTSNFTAENYDALTGTLAGYYKISIAEDANVELKDVTINGNDDENYKWAGLTCEGDAYITITGANSVKGFYWFYPAIQAGPEGTTLTIDGTGTLTATGSTAAAGIGSGRNASCGNITINGGTIYAYSTDAGAGIGSGYYKSSCGDITINGGNVTAISSYNGAGIGSGKEYSSCGDIIINGGDITAISSDNGAGIGSGMDHAACGDIIINGGDITASSSGDGAGIGSGFSNSSCGKISICGGTITASSGDSGAGIGSGYVNSSCGDISISGGDITASSGQYGAGIGSGYVSSFDGITITSDITKVKATTNYAAAWPIGKGYCDNGSGAVSIAGVTVTSKDWDGTGLTGLNFASSSTGGNNLTWTLTPKVP